MTVHSSHPSSTRNPQLAQCNRFPSFDACFWFCLSPFAKKDSFSTSGATLRTLSFEKWLQGHGQRRFKGHAVPKRRLGSLIWVKDQVRIMDEGLSWFFFETTIHVEQRNVTWRKHCPGAVFGYVVGNWSCNEWHRCKRVGLKGWSHLYYHQAEGIISSCMKNEKQKPFGQNRRNIFVKEDLAGLEGDDGQIFFGLMCACFQVCGELWGGHIYCKQALH